MGWPLQFLVLSVSKHLSRRKKLHSLKCQICKSDGGHLTRLWLLTWLVKQRVDDETLTDAYAQVGLQREALFLVFVSFPAFLLVASWFLLLASGFLPSAFVFCLLLSGCCVLFLASYFLLSLSCFFWFLLFAVSFLLPVSGCQRSPESSLLSVLASWFSLTALSFPIAAICCFLLLASFFSA